MVKQKRHQEIIVSQPSELNIWIISLFESTPVDNTRPMRFAGLTQAALRNGHRITHYSCTFRHSTKFERFKEKKQVTISPKHELVFIYATPYVSNISLARLRSHEVFTKNLLADVTSRPKPDIILITLPPLSPANEICKWANRHSIPVVVDIIDPWPDVFLNLAPKLLRPAVKFFFFPFYAKLKSIFKRAAAVTSISNEYIGWARALGKNFKYSGVYYPAVDLEGVQQVLSAKKKTTYTNDKLRIIYAGNLASSYDIPCILDAAELLERTHPGKTEFVICGVGPQASLIDQRTKTVPNVKYLGRLGHDDLMTQYAAADLGLTQHVRGATQSVTYKFFDYLGASLPILNSLQSEMATLIRENGLGLNNEPGNAEKLAENVRELLLDSQRLAVFKRNALQFTALHGDSAKVYKQMTELLEQVAGVRNDV